MYVTLYYISKGVHVSVCASEVGRWQHLRDDSAAGLYILPVFYGQLRFRLLRPGFGHLPSLQPLGPAFPECAGVRTGCKSMAMCAAVIAAGAHITPRAHRPRGIGCSRMRLRLRMSVGMSVGMRT
jgi:hypothetical protein